MTRIAESELILNQDQTIYHLKLSNDDLPDTVITVGDPARVARVSKHFDRVHKTVVNREIVTHIGELAGKPIAVISTGMGVGAIDIVFNELDALANVDFKTRTIKPVHEQRRLKIIRLGTAGGLQKDLEPGTCVVSCFSAGLDSLLHFYQVDFSEVESKMAAALDQHLHAFLPQVHPYVVAGSERLISLFPECVKGITLTCAGFYAPQGRQLRARPLHPGLAQSVSQFAFEDHRITNFEMETAAIYGLGKILNHDCCSISTIVANRINQTYCEDGEAAVDGMIRYALEKIAKF